MKKRLAILLAAVLLLASLSGAFAAGAGEGVTVYVSVSVDGKLEVAAQPVTVTDPTVNGALIAAHEAFCPSGADGYAAGIDAMYNMFMISKAWGVMATPYVLLNGVPLGTDPAIPPTADAAPVADGDSIILSTSSNMAAPSPVVSMTPCESNGQMTVTALLWSLDFMTFTYTSTPYAAAPVIDPVTGASLGTTDENGVLALTAPESGVAAIDGLSAVRVDGSARPGPAPNGAGGAAEETPAELPKLEIGDEPLLSPAMVRFVIVGVIVLIPISVFVIRNARHYVRKDKEAGISQR